MDGSISNESVFWGMAQKEGEEGGIYLATLKSRNFLLAL